MKRLYKQSTPCTCRLPAAEAESECAHIQWEHKLPEMRSGSRQTPGQLLVSVQLLALVPCHSSPTQHPIINPNGPPLLRRTGQTLFCDGPDPHPGCSAWPTTATTLLVFGCVLGASYSIAEAAAASLLEGAPGRCGCQLGVSLAQAQVLCVACLILRQCLHVRHSLRPQQSVFNGAY